jgi:hypothetical protein
MRVPRGFAASAGISPAVMYGADKRLLSSPERNAVSPVATDVRLPTGKNALAGHATLQLPRQVQSIGPDQEVIYIGQDRIDAYAKFLHDLGPILWGVRVILIAALVAHIVVTILAHQNWLAKPQRYVVAGYQRSSSHHER